MSRKSLFLVVGFLWGLLLAAAVGLVVFALAAGIAWIWLFGDDAWPEWAAPAIMAIGLAAGFVTFVICMFIARVVANRQGRADDADGAAEGSSGFAWLAILLTLAGAGGFGWFQYDAWVEQKQERARAEQAMRFFEKLTGETHAITAISVDWPGEGFDGEAHVTLDGLRTGAYRLGWQLRNGLFIEPVLRGDLALTLEAGPRLVDIRLPAQEVVDGYRALLEHRDANVMVDELFLFEVSLAPVLTAAERDSMAPRDLQKSEAGESALVSRAAADFEVRFRLHDGALSWNGALEPPAETNSPEQDARP